jgi:hypothetical protein
VASFIGKDERSWDISIDALKIETIREDAGGDKEFLLGEQGAIESMRRLDRDPVLLCRVLYLLCQEQADKREVTLAQFYDGLQGEFIERAGNALVEAIKSFTPPRQREMLELAEAKTGRIQELIREQQMAVLRDRNLEAEIAGLAREKIDEELSKFMTRLGKPSSVPDLSE